MGLIVARSLPQNAMNNEHERLSRHTSSTVQELRPLYDSMKMSPLRGVRSPHSLPLSWPAGPIARKFSGVFPTNIFCKKKNINYLVLGVRVQDLKLVAGGLRALLDHHAVRACK